jgi:hypothetical protein
VTTVTSKALAAQSERRAGDSGRSPETGAQEGNGQLGFAARSRRASMMGL